MIGRLIMQLSRPVRFVAAFVAAAALALVVSGAAATFKSAAFVSFVPFVSLAPEVDKVFSKWASSTPGCAVGVAADGKPVLAKAYGMADLEHDVKNTPDTRFEAGSVSKQFTAAAVLLLAREGKLSIDDPVRKYVPELPDYPPPPGDTPTGSGVATPKLQGEGGRVPLTIRHMLNHASGLR